VAPVAFGAGPEGLPLPQAWWFEHLAELSDFTVEKGAAATPSSRTGRHQRLWTEASAWVDAVIAKAFAGSGVRWVNRPGKYQVGKLNGTYWARVYPEGLDDLEDAFHVGLQISKRLKWVDKVDDDLAASASGAVLTMWASTNDRLLERLGRPDLRDIYATAQLEALANQPDLWRNGGALVRVHRGSKATLHRAVAYLKAVDAGNDPGWPSLFSPLITVDLVKSNPAEAARIVASYFTLLAEPVLAARRAASGAVEATDKDDDSDGDEEVTSDRIAVQESEGDSEDIDDADDGSAEPQKWPAPWHAASEKYGMLRMKNFPVPEAWALVSRRFRPSEVRAIAKAIRERKTIPVLPFVREALADEMDEWDLKDPWWILPFVVVAEQAAVVVIFDKNGFYANVNQAKAMGHVFAADGVGTLGIEEGAMAEEDAPDDPIRRLVISQRGGDGFLTIDEFQVPGYGSHLEILAAIWEVWEPVVDLFRDEPMFLHGKAGESYRTFADWDSLLAWAQSGDGE
jgi:hypothetical protein